MARLRRRLRYFLPEVVAGSGICLLLLAILGPLGRCNLSPCIVHPPAPGQFCAVIGIIGPCPITGPVIAAAAGSGLVAAIAVGTVRGRRRR